jgi:hypothetical protein
MPGLKLTLVVRVLAISLLTGCSSAGAVTGTPAATHSAAVTPSPAATPTSTLSPTAAPVSAAQILAVANQFWFERDAHPCAILNCPITERLANRMAELIKIQSGYKTGGVMLWCRCQNGLVETIQAEVTSGGGTAHVNWNTGLKMDFLMVVQDGELLVDDTQCTGGGPSTSIYASQLVLCS